MSKYFCRKINNGVKKLNNYFIQNRQSRKFSKIKSWCVSKKKNGDYHGDILVDKKTNVLFGEEVEEKLQHSFK